MTNAISDHPVTRRMVLERLRSIRRSLNKLRTALKKKGAVSNQRRGQLLTSVRTILVNLEVTRRGLDAANPEKSRR